MRHQQGFTLIEVVVAFAIFALAVGAIYGLFRSSVRRSAQADQREVFLLAAQSRLTQLRAQSGAWQTEQTGMTPEGLSWRTTVMPFKTDIAENSAWQAVAVTVSVSVSDPKHPVWEYSLKSIELAYQKAGGQP